MATTKKSELYYYYYYAYMDWGFGIDLLEDGVRFGDITEEEKEEIIQAKKDRDGQ